MVDPVRVFAYTSFFGSMLAWSVVAPDQMSAVAEEPVKAAAATIDSLFPDSVDPKMFRKYKLTFDDSISTEVQRTQVVKKIAHGRTSEVTIVTTPSGTYSTDGLLSPHVQYPGIEKERRGWSSRSWFSSRSYGGGRWTSFSSGSFTYFSYHAAAMRT
jgi:hypothetical protein